MIDLLRSDVRGTEESGLSACLSVPYYEVKSVRRATLYSHAPCTLHLQTAEKILVKGGRDWYKTFNGIACFYDQFLFLATSSLDRY